MVARSWPTAAWHFHQFLSCATAFSFSIQSNWTLPPENGSKQCLLSNAWSRLHGGNTSCGGDVYLTVPVEAMSTKYPMVPVEAMFTKYLTVPVEAMCTKYGSLWRWCLLNFPQFLWRRCLLNIPSLLWKRCLLNISRFLWRRCVLNIGWFPVEAMFTKYHMVSCWGDIY